MTQQLFVRIVVVIALGGFLYDVVSWARNGNHSLTEVLVQYWWAVLFLVATGITALIKRARGDRARRR